MENNKLELTTAELIHLTSLVYSNKKRLEKLVKEMKEYNLNTEEIEDNLERDSKLEAKLRKAFELI